MRARIAVHVDVPDAYALDLDGQKDVLCQARRRLAGRAAGVADVGLRSSAARSVLRAALRVTAAPAIRWVAAMSGTGPDGVGMVTVRCRWNARCRAGS